MIVTVLPSAESVGGFALYQRSLSVLSVRTRHDWHSYEIHRLFASPSGTPAGHTMAGSMKRPPAPTDAASKATLTVDRFVVGSELTKVATAPLGPVQRRPCAP